MQFFQLSQKRAQQTGYGRRAVALANEPEVECRIPEQLGMRTATVQPVGQQHGFAHAAFSDKDEQLVRVALNVIIQFGEVVPA